MDLEKEIFDDALPSEFDTMTAEDIVRKTRLLDNEIRVLKDESTRLSLEVSGLKEKVRPARLRSSLSMLRRRPGKARAWPGLWQVKENKEKIKLNNQLPYLVGNVVEVLDVQPEEDEEVCLQRNLRLWLV